MRSTKIFRYIFPFIMGFSIIYFTHIGETILAAILAFGLAFDGFMRRMIEDEDLSINNDDDYIPSRCEWCVKNGADMCDHIHCPIGTSPSDWDKIDARAAERVQGIIDHLKRLHESFDTKTDYGAGFADGFELTISYFDDLKRKDWEEWKNTSTH